MFINLVSRRFLLMPGQPAPEPIRLRTLILLRWVAIVGQAAAVAVALTIGARLWLEPIIIVIGLAITMNIILSLRPMRRVTAIEVAWQLGFDLAQVAALLAATGGLTNPFAVLLLVPVTIAASTLPGRQLAALAVATFIMVTMAALIARPLTFTAGHIATLSDPLLVGNWLAIIIGALFFALYARTVAAEVSATSDALFAARMALEREQGLQNLGGVVAAAAHELGTPLATIKLIASELNDEIREAIPERADLAEDLAQLRRSVDRCSDIMKSMGVAGRDDLLIRSAPLAQVLEEAAAPHRNRGKTISFVVPDGAPMVQRDAALIHGLRNLIQNAVDFAQSEVTITASIDRRHIGLCIQDDGGGFPPALLPRLGDPFVTTRPRAEDGRGYEGLGLGLFIAKTLLERSGAVVGFANGAAGACITIRWPRDVIIAPKRGALGQNPQIGV